MQQNDLFGNPIEKDVLLRDKFIEPPFSILDTKTGTWQRRKKMWIAKGIQSEVGREAKAINSGTDMYRDIKDKEGYNNRDNYVSVFDPVLCEVLYKWFCPDGGRIFDPFAGGSVRGVVANFLGYRYTGVDIRPEQVESNVEQALTIFYRDIHRAPSWITGDSLEVTGNMLSLMHLNNTFDFVFSCPPYADLEVYSQLPGDISNMQYGDFLYNYHKIIHNSCMLLKPGGYAAFVVGEVRDKDGNYIGFVPDTINAFRRAGMKFYNEAILLQPVASASMRAEGNMRTQKLVKIHQNVLIFKKP